MIKRIVIASDKFKGGLSSLEAGNAIKEGLLDYIAGGELKLFSSQPCIEVVEMADGGDGSGALFMRLVGGERVCCNATDALGESKSAEYIFSAKGIGADGVPTAFIEIAKICGLAMVPEHLRNPLNTTTYGVGEVILDALKRGAERIFLGLGGSATNDCGMGLLQPLGIDVGLGEGVFANGSNIKDMRLTEEAFTKVRELIGGCEFVIVGDVDAPLLGPNGSTYAFAAQKGADQRAIEQMEQQITALLKRLPPSSAGCAERVAEFPSSGASGGIGFILHYLFNAKQVSGFALFGNMLNNLREKIMAADLVISGEGKIDSSSLTGKVAGGVIKEVSALQKGENWGGRLWMFCGTSTLKEEPPIAMNIYQLSDIESDMAARMKIEGKLLRQLSYFAAMEMEMLM